MPLTPTLAQLTEYARPGFWYGLLALTGLYLVAIFVAALVERRGTKPYAGAEPVAPGTPIDGYHAAMNDAAARRGFLYGGTLHHPRHDVALSVWIAPDRLTMIETGAGRILWQRVRQTDVITRTADGAIFVTCDYYGEGDPSGLLVYRQHYNGSLDDLLALHHSRMEATVPVPFAEPDPLSALHAIHAERAARLVRAGRARWLDAEQQSWRYTIRGSICICRWFLAKLGSALTQFWRQWRPRPGVLRRPVPLDPRRYPCMAS